MQGHLEIVLHLSRLIFFPRDDDIMLVSGGLSDGIKTRRPGRD